MAVALARGSASFSSPIQFKHSKKSLKTGFRVSCVYSSADPYSTLRIRPDASESEVKKAFRKLALQYHPDVCRGNNCEIQFLQINEAYSTVMNNLREQSRRSKVETRYGYYATRSTMETRYEDDDYERNVREKTPWYKMDTSYMNYEAKKKDESRSVCKEEDEDLWEEWMGYEGAGIRDYSSHINPYI